MPPETCALWCVAQVHILAIRSMLEATLSAWEAEALRIGSVTSLPDAHTVIEHSLRRARRLWTLEDWIGLYTRLARRGGQADREGKSGEAVELGVFCQVSHCTLSRWLCP